MKIVIFNLYSGINNRGAESFIHELAARLGKNDKVVLISGGEVNIAKVNVINIEPVVYQPTHDARDLIKHLFLDKASFSVLLFTLKSILILIREKPDWVIPINGFWQVVICKILSLFLRFKILITGHSGPGWDERWNLWLTPDVFVATTEPTGKWAKKIAPWVRVEVIPYGVDIDKFKNAKPVNLNLEKPIILCPAAAVPYKRVDLAIKAVAKLDKGSLVHLGGGSLNHELRIMGDKLLGKDRFLSTVVSNVEMPGYFAVCDVVTLPSEPQENSPMVFLEAMAAGKLLVVTDTPRNRWIIGDNGFYIDPTNINDYYQQLARAHIKKHFNYEKDLKKFLWIDVVNNYKRVLDK